jgi:hypothetical protein
VHQIPVPRECEGLDLIHLEESLSWKAEPSRHPVPLRPVARVARGGAKIICTTCARRERDCWLPVLDISSRTLLARARRRRRSGATQVNRRALQRPKPLEEGS